MPFLVSDFLDMPELPVRGVCLEAACGAGRAPGNRTCRPAVNPHTLRDGGRFPGRPTRLGGGRENMLLPFPLASEREWT